MAGVNSGMKLQKASPSPDVIRVRTFRLQQSTDPPASDNQYISPTAGLSGSPGFAAEHSKLLRQASYSSNLSNNSPGRRWETAEGPIEGTHENMEAVDILSPSSTENRDGAESWSSAVGRATISGKSGRVIERLQADNDKLRREIKLYSTKADEEQRRGESIRSELDSLRASNQNLETICDSNRTALARKDRKLEELKEELKHERQRRETAQKAERDTVQQTNQALAEARKEVVREQDIAASTSTQYDVLRRSIERMKNEYQKKIDQVSLEMHVLLRQLNADQERFSSLEIISRQLEHDHDKLARANQDLTESYQSHKQCSEGVVLSFKDRLISAEERAEDICQEMIVTTGKMKQAISIKKHFKDEFNE